MDLPRDVTFKRALKALGSATAGRKPRFDDVCLEEHMQQVHNMLTEKGIDVSNLRFESGV